MRVAIYSPYLDTFGGGERYMMTIAETLSANNFDVEILLDKNLSSIGAEYLKSQLSNRFALVLNKVRFVKAPIGKGSDSFLRTFFLRKFDLLFYLTDGSIFIPSSKRNILHIQSPLIGQPAKSMWGRIKLKNWDLIIYNSEFTRINSLNSWPLNSQVIYPPVETDKIKPLKKKNYILSVGRFFGYLKDKKHGIMIQAFIDLLKSKKISGWSLHLAGAASKGDEPYLKELEKLAKGYPIHFYPNLGYEKLIKLYGQSSVYWHAAGYGENDPTKMEHFGISTVEAMAAGCIPVVIGKGGQVEIVEDKVSGYLWNSVDELKELTVQLVSDDSLRKKISTQAVNQSSNFSKENFVSKILKVTDEFPHKKD